MRFIVMLALLMSACARAQVSYHYVRIYPQGATLGKVCLQEQTVNGSHAFCLKPIASIAANRDITFQDASYTVAGVDIQNVFTQAQGFNGQINARTIYPQLNNTYDLGLSGTNEWNNLYLNNLTINGLVTGHLLPATTSSKDLGSLTRYWNNAFINNLTLGSSLTLSGHLIPGATNTYDLGSTTGPKYWRDLHLDRDLQFHDSGTGNTWAVTQANNSTNSYMQFQDSTNGFTALKLEYLNGGSAVTRVLTNHLEPISGGVTDIGTSGNRYDDAFVTDLNVSGTITAGASSGTTTTLTCGAGEAVKNITIVKGIVTSASCGAP